LGVEAKNGLVGTAMLLDEASVTGTANIVMAAVLAKGTTQYTMLLVNLTCSNYVRC
jgi:UDP-N-acetylglucosamine 1-carboxyvinyltransferase